MSGKNTVARKVATNFIAVDIKSMVASTTSFNQGDFLIGDTTNHIVALPVGETDGATLMGVASCSVVNGKLASAISTDVDAAQALPAIPGPTFGDEYLVVVKSGVTINPLDPVYLDPATGTRGVTNTGTKIIGVWADKALVGDGVKEGRAKIGARFNGDTLKY
jgi:hypothetical protein